MGAALSGFRQALASLTELGIPFDAAIVTMAAISCLGADDPETAGWAARAAEFLEQVGASPLTVQLRRIVETASAGVAASVGGGAEAARHEVPARPSRS
jgi:hypothetical protein